MPLAEVQVWVDHFRQNGFPSDRMVGATAIAGAAVCQTWGGKVKPEELIPKFGKRVHRSDPQGFAAWMASLPGAIVEVSDGK